MANEVIPSVGKIYYNNDTDEQVIVFYAKNGEVRFAPATVNTGQEFRDTWLSFLSDYERIFEHLDAAAFTSAADITVEEGDPLAFSLETDEDPDVTFAITGGADAAVFELTAEVLDFVGGNAPAFATPTDADEDNVYELTVTATDNDGNTTDLDMTVTVTETPAP